MAKRKTETDILNTLFQFDHMKIGECDHLIGLDEVGRGCLAGPVVAGAVVLSKEFLLDEKLKDECLGIFDSKQVKAEKRLLMFEKIKKLADEGHLNFITQQSSVDQIEEFNIVGATALAMQNCLNKLDRELLRTSHVIVDGRPMKRMTTRHEGVVKGDSQSMAIAMASIAAKVTRDQWMIDLAKQYPKYHFDRHKGYGTVLHVQALKEHGSIEGIHRPRFLQKVLP